MANLALIYPKIGVNDFNAIQSIRKRHDPKYFDVVDPHITLIFSTDKLSVDELAEHVRVKLENFKSFKLKFDSAKVVEDDSKEFYHTFLIPSDGFDEINQIHDMLYTDGLESELRHDIPFVPHLGIGTSVAESDMVELAKEINETGLVIAGMAEKIAIVQYDGNKVSDHLSVSLS